MSMAVERGTLMLAEHQINSLVIGEEHTRRNLEMSFIALNVHAASNT